jgi:aryl-alcohol dehydrogenase-like predicted oxidoreductase
MTEPVPVRTLGRSGLKVSMQGLGCMGMSSRSYGPADDAESIRTIHLAIDLGIFFFDTADSYGWGLNEELIGKAIRGRRDHVVIGTKFGVGRADGLFTVTGTPEHVHSACEASLRRLGVDYIDVYYQHRVDPAVPIEDTVGAMAELVAAGKVRYLGLSEASPRSIERASAVHPITALQNEWSLWTRDIEAETLATAREHGIAIVPYSPLGRGFFTGKVTNPDDFDQYDIRRKSPRFEGENFARNLRLVDAVRDMAAARGCLPGQLALAWVMAQGDDVVPIPGTKHVDKLEENAGASFIELTAEDLDRLDAIAAPGAVAGARYSAYFNHAGYRDTPEREPPPVRGAMRGPM